MDEISDVKGLYPTFVMNILPKSALSVAKNNGIGNTWGLNDTQSYIRECSPAALDARAPKWSSSACDLRPIQSGSFRPAGQTPSMICA